MLPEWNFSPLGKGSESCKFIIVILILCFYFDNLLIHGTTFIYGLRAVNFESFLSLL